MLLDRLPEFGAFKDLAGEIRDFRSTVFPQFCWGDRMWKILQKTTQNGIPGYITDIVECGTVTDADLLITPEPAKLIWCETPDSAYFVLRSTVDASVLLRVGNQLHEGLALPIYQSYPVPWRTPTP